MVDIFITKSVSMYSLQNYSIIVQNDNANLRERRNSFTQGGTNGLPPNPTEAQLKYENDRLKLALAQRSVYGILFFINMKLFMS